MWRMTVTWRDFADYDVGATSVSVSVWVPLCFGARGFEFLRGGCPLDCVVCGGGGFFV
jgi:hypothetical protein